MAGDFAGRTVLVTGASRGIGGAVARALGAAGAHVIALARTVGALEALDDDIKTAGGTTTLVPLDLKDYGAIDRLGAALFQRYGHIDAVVGNAGLLGVLAPTGHIDPKLWEEVMAVNVTANWRLIRSLDPLLRKAPAGRALFVTSGVARHPRAYWSLYGASKAALEHLVRTYADEMENTSVRANLYNPGATRTRMRAAAMPAEDPSTLPTPEEVAAAMLPLLLPSCTATGRVYDFQRASGTAEPAESDTGH
jgi:NAD(P)-dependent dehydrogenase (short-subunit alcohol dehydrogenase family)